MDADIPIDIHYNKLLDWLINRRHCPSSWQGAVLTVREKINAAIQDMPPVEEITKLLQGTYINYFHCLRIVQLLKDTESGTKNIFGRYSSQRMKDWQEIVKLYEKDDVYLAEAAQLLARNVNYEIPSLKKQIARCKQAQQDCSRKEVEYTSSASELREKYAASCRMMGIEGKKLKSELFALVKDMPDTYSKVARSTANIQTAVNYYREFVKFSVKKDDISSESLPVLSCIMDCGDVTTFQFRHGKPPTKIEEPVLELSFDDEEKAGKVAADEDAQIDWGIDEEAKIDFGDGDAIDFGEGGIDWGDSTDINIEVVGDESGLIKEEQDIPPASDDGVARGDDARTLLDNPKMRSKFIDELNELEAFLGQRVAEAGADADVVCATLLQMAPPSLQVERTQLQQMLTQVQELLGTLTNKRMQDLLLIRSSPRYVERLAASMHKNLDDAEKLVLRARLMVTRQQEAHEEERQTEPKLDLIRLRTTELKNQIEGEVSKKYKNRPVNIMGEINTV